MLLMLCTIRVVLAVTLLDVILVVFFLKAHTSQVQQSRLQIFLKDHDRIAHQLNKNSEHRSKVIMDRSWINAKRTSVEYENGVEEFFRFATSHVASIDGNKFYCPCVKCLNDKIFTVEEIREHVICDGFNKKYTRWIWHGEFDMPDVSQNEGVRNEEGDEDMHDEDMSDNLEELINDIGAEAFEQTHVNRSYNTLSANADKSLYPGCLNFSQLSATLKLISLKAAHIIVYVGYFCSKGWELMAICPKFGCVAWFSCMAKGKKQKKKVPEMIETAFEAYQVVKGMRPNTLTKPKWFYPKCCQQDVGDAECGLFVMRRMLEIIKLDTVNSFEKVFDMEEPYSSDDIDDVRRRWAESFLEVV
ncbi:hypothetical protein CASFOL_001571 [Castilleja foliolosa]|uniref:Transposase-associated domain-containing protein n=1 Tax=Castilleja foliolosa TaxID=1961234 RepID=A0ABD3EK69_9LAMI